MPALLPETWPLIPSGLAADLQLLAFAFACVMLAAALCGLRSRRRKVRRGDVIFCLPLDAIMMVILLLPLVLVAATLFECAPLLAFAIGFVAALILGGGTMALLVGLPFFAIAAFAFSFIVFRHDT